MLTFDGSLGSVASQFLLLDPFLLAASLVVAIAPQTSRAPTVASSISRGPIIDGLKLGEVGMFVAPDIPQEKDFSTRKSSFFGVEIVSN